MKNTSNFFLFMILFATFFACNKEDEYQPKKIIYEYIVCIDSFIMHDAVYIDPDTTVVYVDSVKPYDFVFAKATSKVIFDRKDNLSAQYIGGYHDTCFVDICPVDPYPMIVPHEIDPSDTVIYLPVEFKRYINLSYAILKITNGTETIVDTAWYYLSSDLKTKHYEIYEDKKSYSEVFSLYADKNVTPGENYYILDSYYKLPYSFQNHTAYIVDIFPYWKIPIDSTQIVYFIQ